ncbi:phenylalanine--tRNA ligase subunit alpha [bacterium]|nr:phenylalanine--tRNA ligase subunit alpha [bacterium]
MRDKINSIQIQAENDLSDCSTIEDIENLRVKFLGKKGQITLLYQNIKDVAPEDRPQMGQFINDLKQKITSAIVNVKDRIEKNILQKRLEQEAIDVTLPGRSSGFGKIHPLAKTMRSVIKIFQSIGFSVAQGPEVETEYYNFDALNIPSYHPARDMQDTFFLENGKLLRTHTSPVQIRVMENRTPPVRIIAPGRVYRNEAINARSYCLFHQVEGFYVDSSVTFSELKGVLGYFAKELFGEDSKIRIRPSFFPFTEPSLECDVSCFLCSGKGCRVCKKTGWLEILGAGMIHPAVLRSVGYDSSQVQGYAFGMGIERITMLLYGINDIRLFFENDLRFLSQF